MSFPMGVAHSHSAPLPFVSSSPSSSLFRSSSAAPPRVSGGLSLNAKRRREADQQADGQQSPDGLASPSPAAPHCFSRPSMHSPCDDDAADLCDAFVDDDFCSSFDAPSRSHAASVSSAAGAAARSPLREPSDAAPHSSTPFKWTRGSPAESCSSEGGACSVTSSGAQLYGEQRDGASLCFSSSSSSISVRDGIAAITLSRSTAAGHASASAHACTSMLASPCDGELKRAVSDSTEGVPALSHAPHLHQHTGLYQRSIHTPTRANNNNNNNQNAASSSSSSSSGVVALSTLNSAPVDRAVLVTPSNSRSRFNGADDDQQQHNQHVRPSQRVSDLDVGAHDHEACFMEEDIEAPVAVVPAAVVKAAVAAAAVQPVKPAHTVVPAPAPRPLSPRERSLDGSRVTGMQRLLERQNVVRVLSCSMEQLCPLTATLPADPMFLSLFHTSAMPGISIREYMERLAIYTAVSEESMITASIHIVRLAHNGRAEAASRNYARSTGAPVPAPSSTHPRINSFSPEPFQVSCFNIHRLLLTALLVTAKYADDAFHNNRLFSSLGGITLREINQLEAEFLHLLDYRMGVDLDSFQMMWNEVFNSAARHGPACCSAPHTLAPRIVVEEEPGCGVELDESFFESHSADPLALAEVESEQVMLQQEWAGPTSMASASAVAAAVAGLKPIPARLDGEVVSAPIFSAHIASAVPSSAPTAPASLVHSGPVRASVSASTGVRPLSVPRVQSTTSTTSLGSSMESCDMDVEREEHSVNAAESSESARTTPFLSPQEATVAAGSAAAAASSNSCDDQVLSAEPPRLSAQLEDKARESRSQSRHKAHLQVSVHSQSPSSNLGLQRVSCTSLQSVTRCQGIQGDSMSGACTPSPSTHSHHYAKRGAARGGNASASSSSCSGGKHGAHRAEPSVSVSSRYTRAHAYGHHGGFNPYTPSPFMAGSGSVANDDNAYDMLM